MDNDPNKLMQMKVAQDAGDFWFPPAASTFAAHVDDVFWFIYWFCAFFFVLIMALMMLFVVKYRRKDGVGPEPSPHHNTLLEVGWSVIPSGMLVIMFWRGFVGYMDQRTPPDEAYDVKVYAKKWNWAFGYPTGDLDNSLHIVNNEPTRLTMTSDDVIHSLYVPAFRAKQDVVPGRYSTMWFTPNKPGEYALFCTEYCGDEHSKMLAKVVVEPDQAGMDKYLNLLADDPNKSPEEKGQQLYLKRGCAQCHSIDGSPNKGPTFKGDYGSVRKLKDGTTCVVEDNYIRESILEPMAKVADGYQPVMPSFKGQLKERDLDYLIAFIKSLKGS